MKMRKNMLYSSIISILIGLIWTMGNSYIGPLMLAYGIILTSFYLFNTKKPNSFAFIVVTLVTLALMFSLEYFMIHIQSTVFYVLLFVMIVGTVLTFFFSFKPMNVIDRRDKIIAWVGAIIFSISFFGLISISIDNFEVSITFGALFLFLVVGMLFIRRKISKDIEEENEFEVENEQDEFYPTKLDFNEYWFKFKVGGISKPISWQGWACYVLILLSPGILIFVRDPITCTIFVVAIIFIVTIVSILKSDYKATVKEYRENLKKENER
jgi:hypothetical protein